MNNQGRYRHLREERCQILPFHAVFTNALYNIAVYRKPYPPCEPVAIFPSPAERHETFSHLFRADLPASPRHGDVNGYAFRSLRWSGSWVCPIKDEMAHTLRMLIIIVERKPSAE
jgi:hypothetical protein